MAIVSVNLIDTFDEWRVKTNNIGTNTGDLTTLNTTDKSSIVAAINELSNKNISSANDPTTSSNPVGGLGTIWTNTTSGEMYVCTNITTGSNVWINVGGGSGDIS